MRLVFPLKLKEDIFTVVCCFCCVKVVFGTSILRSNDCVAVEKNDSSVVSSSFVVIVFQFSVMIAIQKQYSIESKPQDQSWKLMD